MFAMVRLRLETGIDELIKSNSLLFCNVANLIPKDHLLKSHERQLWVVLAGKEAAIFLEDGFVARLIKSPVFKEFVVER